MMRLTGSWREFVLRSLVLGVVVFVAVRAANATQGGHTRNALTVAGTITGVTGTPTLAFTLRKGTTTCPATARNVVLNGTTFSAEVPLEGCPAFFDGSDVTVDVSVNGTPVVSGGAVNPVPYARYADQYGTPDCPVGYEKEQGVTSFTLCSRGIPTTTRSDEVVRVGNGATAFWIDRYEAGVFVRRPIDGPSVMLAHQFGRSSSVYPAEFSVNGQWNSPSGNPFVYAYSTPDLPPASNITWFQAQEACRASGKRLPTGEEWLAAARGTPDPAPGEGCITATAVRDTGRVTLCRSAWGAEDMVGNLTEWTAEWYAGAGNAYQQASQTISVNGAAGNVVVPSVSAGFINSSITPWPSGFGGDGTTNIAGFVDRGGGGESGLPAAAQRGGHYESGTQAGVFALELTHAPSNAGPRIGFRCVIPR